MLAALISDVRPGSPVVTRAVEVKQTGLRPRPAVVVWGTSEPIVATFGLMRTQSLKI